MIQFFESIAQQFNKTFIVDDRYLYFLKGLQNTIITALAATLMGVIIGVIVAIVKVLHKKTVFFFQEDRFVLICGKQLPLFR